MAFNFSKLYTLSLTRHCRIFICKQKHLNYLQTRQCTVNYSQKSISLQTSHDLLQDAIQLRDIKTNHSIIDVSIIPYLHPSVV